MADINYESIIEELGNVNEMKDLAELRDLAVRALAASESCDLKTQADIRIKLESGLVDVINQYTSESKNAMYRTIAADPDPMRRAVTEFVYGTIRIKETKNKELKCTIREIADGSQAIDLLHLHKWVGEHTDLPGIGKDMRWVIAFNRLNVDMAKAAAIRYNDRETQARLMDPTQLRIHKEDLEFDFGKEDTLAAIDKVVKLMIGDEYSADAIDYNMVYDTYVSNDSKSATAVKINNERAFAAVLKKVCYRQINHLADYKVMTKLLKSLKK